MPPCISYPRSSIPRLSTSKYHNSSFSSLRINATTFVIREDDAYGEYPFIYAKLIPRKPFLVLSDTGCDEPSERKKKARFIRLRDYLENCPLECNDNRPLNPGGPPESTFQSKSSDHNISKPLRRSYIIICTHCHYDHTGGIMQFLAGGTTSIVASSAGRDFIESDLATHGLFKYMNIPVPWYQVTHYAESLERLRVPFDPPPDDDELLQSQQPSRNDKEKTDLGISIIHTPGHTPDELAWYDHAERHLVVGDSFYEEGKEEMPIIFPREGNLIEWVFSMQKLAVFVKGENARLAGEMMDDGIDGEEDWVNVVPRVKVSCAHQTTWVDGEKILADLEKFAFRVYGGLVPVVKKEIWLDEMFYTWRDEQSQEDGDTMMSIQAPVRLIEQARKFFNLDVKTE